MNYNFAHDSKTNLGTAEQLFHDLHCTAYELGTINDSLSNEELANGWVICRDIIGSVSRVEDAWRQIGMRLTEAKTLSVRLPDEQGQRWHYRSLVFESAFQYLSEMK